MCLHKIIYTLNLKIEKRADLKFLVIVFIYNLILAVSAVILTATTKLKDWISEFGLWQIVLIIIYASAVVIEVIGSKYIFNKGKLKSGWIWFITILSKNKINDFDKCIRSKIEDEFIKNNKFI